MSPPPDRTPLSEMGCATPAASAACSTAPPRVMGSEEDQLVVAPRMPPLSVIAVAKPAPVAACTRPPPPRYSEPPVRFTAAVILVTPDCPSVRIPAVAVPARTNSSALPLYGPPTLMPVAGLLTVSVPPLTSSTDQRPLFSSPMVRTPPTVKLPPSRRALTVEMACFETLMSRLLVMTTVPPLM